jgi:hypothetical protein
MEQLQATALLRALQEHDVSFVVIGGFGLSAHGFIRATKDLDIVPDPDRENLERLGAMLQSVDAYVDLKDLDSDELGIKPDGDGLAEGGNWVLMTRFGLLDVLQTVAGVSGFAALRAEALEVPLPALERPVLFAGYEHVIAMKSAAGRPQDLIDIDSLQRARGERE